MARQHSEASPEQPSGLIPQAKEQTDGLHVARLRTGPALEGSASTGPACLSAYCLKTVEDMGGGPQTPVWKTETRLSLGKSVSGPGTHRPLAENCSCSPDPPAGTQPLEPSTTGPCGPSEWATV